MKVCTNCKVEKPVTEFHKLSIAPDGLRYECKPCENKRSKQWRDKNPDRASVSAKWKKDNPDKVKDYQFRHAYGITYAQKLDMIAAQSNTCDICLEIFSNSFNTHVDHNHSTGQVRSILCGGCNKGLGDFKEDPQRLRRAAAYLDGWA